MTPLKQRVKPGSDFWEMNASSLKSMWCTGLTTGGSFFLGHSRRKGNKVAAKPAFPETAVSYTGLLPSSTPGQAAFQILGPSGDSLPNPVIHLLSHPPLLRAQTFKVRGKSLGKQLSGQSRVLSFEAGSWSARRQAVWSQEPFPCDQMWEMDMFIMLNWTHTC